MLLVADRVAVVMAESLCVTCPYDALSDLKTENDHLKLLASVEFLFILPKLPIYIIHSL